MLESEVHPEILRAVEERNFGLLRKLLENQPAREVADAIEGLPEDQRAVVFRLLPRDEAAETFEYLEPEAQENLLKALGREHVAGILNDMSPDDRTALLEELPAPATRQLLTLLSPEEKAIAIKLLGYPEDSIGRLMTPDAISVRPTATVGSVLEHIRQHGQDKETLNVIYVVDERGTLIDDMRIRELLVKPLDVKLDDIRDGSFVALRAFDDQEEAIRVFAETDRVALPVVDSRGALLGIVTVDDVLDVVEEEATEDIQKIGGMEALEHSYMQAGFLELIRKRGGWLILLFLGQLLTLNAMGIFAERLREVAALVLFVPLIISSGGNSGSQAATLVVRALALGEVQLGDWWKVIRREILFGLAIGSVLASVGAARILLGEAFGDGFGVAWSHLSLAIGLSLICVVLWGVVIGSTLPFAMKRLGADPAASSTPFVATVVDVTGLVLYFTVALSVLR